MSDSLIHLHRIMIEAAQLPVLDVLVRPIYERIFVRNRWRDLYRGVYPSFAAARASAPAVRPVGYDHAATARLYRDRPRNLRASDYPVMFWIASLIEAGCRRVFDLGGHFGITYYALGQRMRVPDDLDWCVHDVPAVVASGREYAETNDPLRRLRFSERREDADGADVLLAGGVLQYLDYTLADLLGRLAHLPRYLVIGQVPLHPSRSFFTLQSIGSAFCPYRVTAEPEFVASLETLGYVALDCWESREKSCRIPGTRGYSVERYQGFCFRRAD